MRLDEGYWLNRLRVRSEMNKILRDMDLDDLKLEVGVLRKVVEDRDFKKEGPSG